MRQGSKRLWLGLVMVAGGLVAGALTFKWLYEGRTSNTLHEVPGTFSSVVPESGRYYVWHHYRVKYQGTQVRHARRSPEAMKISIRNEEEQEVPFIWDSSNQWEIGNHGKVSLGYWDADRPGVFRVVMEGNYESRIVSAGVKDMGVELKGVFTPLGIGVVSVLVGVVLMLWGLIVRLRNPERDIFDEDLRKEG